MKTVSILEIVALIINLIGILFSLLVFRRALRVRKLTQVSGLNGKGHILTTGAMWREVVRAIAHLAFFVAIVDSMTLIDDTEILSVAEKAISYLLMLVLITISINSFNEWFTLYLYDRYYEKGE